jgi:hypothetical protein
MVDWESLRGWAHDLIALLRVGASVFRRRRSERSPKQVGSVNHDRRIETKEIEEISQTFIQIRRVVVVKKSYAENKERE